MSEHRTHALLLLSILANVLLVVLGALLLRQAGWNGARIECLERRLAHHLTYHEQTNQIDQVAGGAPGL